MELPLGYSRSEVVWSGFEDLLEESDGPNVADFTGLRLTGTIEVRDYLHSDSYEEE